MMTGILLSQLQQGLLSSNTLSKIQVLVQELLEMLANQFSRFISVEEFDSHGDEQSRAT
jgi:hypothetical protein